MRRVPLRIGPAPEPPPKPRPFTVLAKLRFVSPGLPSDLTAWYSRHEGVGLDGSAMHAVKLGKLAEVQPVHASDLASPSEAAEPGYEGFRGLRIAVGLSGVPIVYVLAGKLYRFGTVFAQENASRFVLDTSHVGWLARLARDEWFEWGLARDRWGELQKGKAQLLRRHFERLNGTGKSVDPPGEPEA